MGLQKAIVNVAACGCSVMHAAITTWATIDDELRIPLSTLAI